MSPAGSVVDTAGAGTVAAAETTSGRAVDVIDAAGMVAVACTAAGEAEV
ncbi:MULTISPECIES: hypothetical protein [Streptosporangiaceae]